MQINHGPSLATLSLGQLAEIVGGVLGGSADAAAPISIGPGRITIHSTRVESGSIFFALQGKRDGHDWVQDALAHGAHCAIVKSDAAAFQSAGPVLGVRDPLDALQKLGAWYRQQLLCDVIAVAGSLGKTTTKEALVSFLSESEFCYGSPGSYNSQIGVALSILGCPRDAERAVIEVAATEPHEFAKLASILRPTTVVITMIGNRFRNAFGSMDGYLNDLMSLTKYQRAGGLVVCGSNDVDIAHKLSSSLTLLSPFDKRWPIISESQVGTGGTAITFRTISDVVRQLEVATSSSWLAADVAIAVATVIALGKSFSTPTYAPTSLDLQTWRSPIGAHVLRSAAVDDAIAWRIAIADAFAAGKNAAHIYFVMSDAVHALSRDTLLTLHEIDARQNCAILMTDGHAADVLKSSGVVTPVRVFDTAADLGRTVASLVNGGDVVAVFAGRSQLIEGVSKELLNAMAPARLRVDIGPQ